MTLFLSLALLGMSSSTFEAHEGVTIERDPQKKLHFAECTGESRIIIKDERTKMEHHLVSYGKMSIDPKNHKTHLESPVGSDGEVPSGKQIHFKDDLGEIYANKAVLTYAYLEGRLHPEFLELEGDVKIENHWGGASHYALADHARFRFETNVLQLEADPKGSVLVFDPVNKLQVSAPKIEMKRESQGEEKIQGFGHVRFVFEAKELEAIKKKFPLLKE